ncbi:MAG: hypothetical protein PHF84_02095 [bacterium]|nr:hypothetical protein [bacterium]
MSKRKKISILSLLVFLILFSIPHDLCSLSGGGISGVLQRVNLDARFMSLGSAFDSLSYDASGVYYNPAGLAFLPDMMLLASYMPVWDNLTHLFFVGTGFKTKYFPMGVGLISVDTSGIKVRRDSPVVTDLMEYGEVALFCSGAYEVITSFSVGLRLGFHNLNIYHYNDWGIGADLSLLWHVRNPYEFTKSKLMRFLQPFSLGIVLYNILPPSVKLYQKSVSYPLMMKSSLSYQFRTIGNFLRPELGVGFQSIFENKATDFSTGLELTFWNFFYVRGGYSVVDGMFSIGSGIEMMNIIVDYGLLPLKAGLKFYTLNLKVKF